MNIEKESIKTGLELVLGRFMSLMRKDNLGKSRQVSLKYHII